MAARELNLQVDIESLTWHISAFNPVLELKREVVMHRLNVLKASASSRDHEAIESVSIRLGMALANPEVNWRVSISQLAEFTFEAIEDTEREGTLNPIQARAWQEGSLFLAKPIIETVLGGKKNKSNAEITFAFAIARRKLANTELGLTT